MKDWDVVDELWYRYRDPVAGRLDWVADMHADGGISSKQAARLANIVSDDWEPDYDA